MSDPTNEAPKCPSTWCGRGKFERPKRRCSDVSFHWLLAGREWTKDEDGIWQATETRQSRREAFDGLLVDDEEDDPKGDPDLSMFVPDPGLIVRATEAITMTDIKWREIAIRWPSDNTSMTLAINDIKIGD